MKSNMPSGVLLDEEQLRGCLFHLNMENFTYYIFRKFLHTQVDHKHFHLSSGSTII